MKFPDEVPVLGTRHKPDKESRKTITTKGTSLRNFMDKPFKINKSELPEVLKQKKGFYVYNMKNNHLPA